MNDQEPDACDCAQEEEDAGLPGFEMFGLNDQVMLGIQNAGFKTPSLVQEETIPAVLTGRDVIAQAHTGSGNTAAFALPALHQMKFNGGIEVVVLTPTRELALQVSTEIHRLGKFTQVRTGTVYGGQPYNIQYKMFERGIHVLVATPGRLLDHLRGGKLELSPSLVIIDEADEMLDMGFLDDVKEILGFFKSPHQTLLFSATIPAPIRKLADSFLKDPLNIRLIGEEGPACADVRQVYYVIEERERTPAVTRLLESLRPGRSIIFVRMRIEVDQLVDSLASQGFSVKALHGDMEQRARNFVMGQFRQGQADILVATDVAARGLDVPEVSHVFNYHLPFDSKSYVHRIGRTGRAGRKGTAITLVTPQEFRTLKRIQFIAGENLERGRVPSLKQIRLDRHTRLLHDLEEATVTGDATTLAMDLSVKLDSAEKAAQHLAAMLLAMRNKRENGPEEIGLSDERVERLLRPHSKQKGGDRDGGFEGRGKRGNFGRREEWKPRGEYKPRKERKKREDDDWKPAREHVKSDLPPSMRVKEKKEKKEWKERAGDKPQDKKVKPSRLRRNERRADERKQKGDGGQPFWKNFEQQPESE